MKAIEKGIIQIHEAPSSKKQNKDVFAGTLAAIPLRRNNLVIGVLLVSSHFGEAFSEGDKKLMRAFGALTGPALDQAKLRQHLQLINKPAGQGETKIHENVVHAIYELTGKPISFWEVERTGNQITRLACRGMSATNKDNLATVDLQNPVESFTSYALKTHQPYLCEDIFSPNQPARFALPDLAHQESWKSVLVVPFYDSEGQPLGTINLYDTVHTKFSQNGVEFLRNFTNQAARLIESARRRDQMMALFETGQIGVQHLMNKKKALRKCLEILCKSIGAPCAVIYPYDTELSTFFEKETIICYGLNQTQTMLKDKAREKGLAQIIRHTGLLVLHDLDEKKVEPLDLSVVPAIEGRPAVDKASLFTIIRGEKFIQREEIKACIGLSLRASQARPNQAETEIGILYINYRNPHQFTPSEINLFQLFAQQVANAIRAAHLVENQQEQLKISRMLVKASSALEKASSTNDVLKETFRFAFTFIGKVTGMMLRVYPRYRLQTIASKGVTPEQLKIFHGQSPEKIKISSFGKIILEGEIFTSINTKDSINKGEMTNLGLPIPEKLTNIPLKVSGKTTGILVIDTFVPDTSEKWKALLALTEMSNTALEKMSAYEHSTEQFEALQKIVDATSGNKRDPLAVILEQAALLFDAQHGTIGLTDLSEKILHFKFHWKDGRLLRPDEISPEKLHDSLDGGITGWVARNGKSRRIQDVRDKQEAPDYREWWPETRSELTVPLFDSKNACIGILDLESDQVGAFDRNDEILCVRFAAMASVAIKMARLIKDTRRLYKQLDELPKVVNEKSLSNALRRVLRGINAIIREVDEKGADLKSNIYLYDHQKNRLLPSSAVEGALQIDITSQPRPSGTGYYVIEHKRPLYYPDVGEIPPDAPDAPRVKPAEITSGVKSYAALPLIHNNQILGVLFIHLGFRISFSPDLRRILETYASQAAIAIEEAQIKIGQEASRKIRNAVNLLEWENFLQLLVNEAVKVTQADYGEIWLMDRKTNDLVLQAFKRLPGVSIKIGRRIGIEASGPNLDAVTTKKSVILESITYQASSTGNFPGAHSSLTLPLVYQDEVIGTLNVESEREKAFSLEQELLLRPFVSEAGMAFENARLLAQRVNDLTALQDINEAIGKQSLPDIYKLIARKANEITRATYSTLWIRDEASTTLTLGAVDGRPAKETTIELDAKSINSRVAKRGKAYLSGDVTKDKYYRAWYDDIRSNMSVPLIHNNFVIGTLNVESTLVDTFSKEQVQLLQALAHQAVIAIEKNRLFEKNQTLQAAWVEEQQKIRKLERSQILEKTATEVAHWIINDGGAIPHRVQIVRSKLRPNNRRDNFIMSQLDIIDEIWDDFKQTVGKDKRPSRSVFKELVDINELIDISVRKAVKSRPETEKRIKIHKKLMDHLPILMLEKEHLLVTLENIIQNGLDAIRENGSITIKTNLSIGINNQLWIEIQIKDTGIGIQQSNLGKVFDLGYTTKPDGMGFGLARARIFIQEIGGEISVESKIGSGSTFTIRIPTEEFKSQDNNSSLA